MIWVWGKSVRVQHHLLSSQAVVPKQAFSSLIICVKSVSKAGRMACRRKLLARALAARLVVHTAPTLQQEGTTTRPVDTILALIALSVPQSASCLGIARENRESGRSGNSRSSSWNPTTA